MKYIIANWKMKMDKKSVEEWINSFLKDFHLSDTSKKIIIAPTSIHIPLLSSINTKVSLATQDVSEHEKGSYTGDLGNFQLKDFCEYAIVGHSERNEPRETVYTKRDKCLELGITPIVCFTDPSQLIESYAEGALLAWEDPENIAKDGIFVPKDPKDIEIMYNTFHEIFPNIDVIYGGSVNRDNVSNLVSIKNLGGVLLGTASLDPRHFLDIYESF